MKNRLLVILFTFIFAFSLYAEEGEVLVIEESEEEIFVLDGNTDLSFLSETPSFIYEEDTELLDLSLTEEVVPQQNWYDFLKGRNKVSVDFWANLPMYGVPYVIDTLPSTISSGLPFGLDNVIDLGSMLGIDQSSNVSSWGDVVRNFAAGMDPIELGGASIEAKDLLADFNLGISAKSGSFGMKFGYDYVVNSWLAVSFDVNFAIGGIDINMSGMNLGTTVKTVAKTLVVEQFSDMLGSNDDLNQALANLGVDNVMDANLGDLLTEMGMDSDDINLGDFNSTLTDMGITGVDLGNYDLDDYATFGDFFDALYDDIYDQLDDDFFDSFFGSSGESAISTISGDSSSSGIDIKSLLEEDIELNLGLDYRFVEHSIGLKLFPGKKAPWGFYVMPKLGISFLDITLVASSNDAVTDLVNSQISSVLGDIDLPFVGSLSPELPFSQTLVSGWGAYAALELGWQIQIAPKATADWPVQFGIDLVLFDIGYYFHWSDTTIQSAIQSFVPSDFSQFLWALNLRGSFFPKLAFSVRF